MPPTKKPYDYFRIFFFLKGVQALFEFFVGVLTFFISPARIQNFVDFATYSESTEDPRDFVTTYIVHLSQTLTLQEKSFIAFYLVAYGLIKFFLVVGLLKERLWAYPAALIAFSAMVSYQLYRYTHTHSTTLLLLTVFDIFVIYMVWLEYKKFSKKTTPALL